jgi:ATP-dependent protease HslVU (ClpYQ) peptidase subunit
MTCLIGLLQGGKTYIGADGYATTQDCEKKPVICRKLFKSGKYIIAFAGQIRTGQLLYPESGFRFPDTVYQIPNSMYQWLSQYEAIGKDETQVGIINANFLIITKDRIYSILGDLSMSEIDPTIGYTAVGSGSDFAMGSLYSTNKTRMSAKKRIQEAFDAASAFLKNCGPPYSIYSYSGAQRMLSSTYIEPENGEY